ncbi:MAG: hypothetical protein WC740_07875 [Verrucomicrobiia bacterium]
MYTNALIYSLVAIVLCTAATGILGYSVRKVFSRGLLLLAIGFGLEAVTEILRFPVILSAYLNAEINKETARLLFPISMLTETAGLLTAVCGVIALSRSSKGIGGKVSGTERGKELEHKIISPD